MQVCLNLLVFLVVFLCHSGTNISTLERDYLKYAGMFELQTFLDYFVSSSGKSLDALSKNSEDIRATIWIDLSCAPTRFGIYRARPRHPRLPKLGPSVTLMVGRPMIGYGHPISAVQADETMRKQLGILFERGVDLDKLNLCLLTSDPAVPENWFKEGSFRARG